MEHIIWDTHIFHWTMLVGGRSNFCLMYQTSQLIVNFFILVEHSLVNFFRNLLLILVGGFSPTPLKNTWKSNWEFSLPQVSGVNIKKHIWVATNQLWIFFSGEFWSPDFDQLGTSWIFCPRMAMEIWWKLTWMYWVCHHAPTWQLSKEYIYIYLEHLRGAKWMERGAH